MITFSGPAPQTCMHRLLALAIFLIGCGPEFRAPRAGDEDARPLPADLTQAPLPAPMQPATGPANAATVELGRLLFFDPVLSGDRDIACATCHHPSLAWADGRPLSVGTGGTGLGSSRRSGGHVTTRNSMTVLNTALNGVTARDLGPDPATAPMFWDHRVRSLEAQAAEPILAADEMRGTRFTAQSIFPEVEARLRATPEYVSRFADAFGAAGISRDTITQALAAFERGLLQRESTFDRRALSAAQQRGQAAFGQHGCPACHGGPLFSDFQLHRLGVSGLTSGVRPPSLRMVARTAPYMHDGSLPTLEAVLQFYGRVDRQLDPALRGVRGFSQQEVADVVAFLQALSDGAFDTSVPERVPSGLPVGGR